MNHIYWAKLSISTFDFNWSHSCVCITSLTYAFGHWRATSQGDKEMSYPFVSFITYTGLGFVKQRQLMGFPSCKYFSSFCLQHLFFVQSLGCVQLCDPMDCNTPRVPVPHHLLELDQTHVH